MASTSKSPYRDAVSAPLIQSPALRVPPRIELPEDIHPLPDTVLNYFVYPYTLEPHILTLESNRRSTLAVHAARRQALLDARAEDRERRRKAAEDERERRRREELRRVAPGWEGHAGAALVPTRTETGSGAGPGHGRGKSRDVMDDLVDQLARLEGDGT
ncbi:hypothetical protein CONPUDRAFT_92448 [Coniophora puteana RWD-64-598 SS2]|uniref:Uncharacterized protein n=1 Tax=Coniophora puteana (strain RWD-64-598) TaxID=741705 RepID=A0A5M3MDB1_CONPW|nr:uncharacterized protein CONPUDRAFT_92448 [Coniophora puteana RWD-64-598 SS2]EIW77242.1 hypothetical protein CONPUDRAFT_92448 [Coniophora puteana RWD-64-598 SS2]